MEKNSNILQFVPFSSRIDPGFWHQFTKKKLVEYKLDDSPVLIHGSYTNGEAKDLPSFLNVDYNSIEETWKPPQQNSIPLSGTITNTNTLEEFKKMDKVEFIRVKGGDVWEDIVSGKAIDNPLLLSKFFCLSFSDLKKYHYYYWFCFPALCFPTVVSIQPPQPIAQRMTSSQMEDLEQCYCSLTDLGDKAYFLIHIPDDNGAVKIHPLKDFAHIAGGKVWLGFSDPSVRPSYPGWVLRNLLALVGYHWGQSQTCWTVVALRRRFQAGSWTLDPSVVLDLDLQDTTRPSECPQVVGWEKNKENKDGPRVSNLSSKMDPRKLAENAVDLNLDLMRWRMMPELDLEKVKTTRCLVLGAGTIGCNIARLLLGWGVRTITFVDNGQVSYSNPVRQSLYTFADCSKANKTKAELAAESVASIFPGVKSKGHVITIPMPGHSVCKNMEEQVRADVLLMETLVLEHDVIFMGMDTRESRWLPTLLGAAHSKIVINAALGFDTYVVQRHGLKPPSGDKPRPLPPALGEPIPGDMLGCYFCNDVVAPGDSTRDRTLDQQCTVTLPGVSYKAAGNAVELMATLLQHPLGGLANAYISSKDGRGEEGPQSPLGVLPHQIRGSRFNQDLYLSMAFDKCTACSSTVVEAYRRDGFEFLLQVFNHPNYLEDLTGLTELHKASESALIMEFSDDESFTTSLP